MKKYYFALSQKLDPLYQIVGPPETVHLYAVVDWEWECIGCSQTFFFFFTLYVDKYTNKGIYWRECKSDIASRLVHKESKLMFTLSGQNDQRKNRFSFSVNEP